MRSSQCVLQSSRKSFRDGRATSSFSRYRKVGVGKTSPFSLPPIVDILINWPRRGHLGAFRGQLWQASEEMNGTTP